MRRQFLARRALISATLLAAGCSASSPSVPTSALAINGRVHESRPTEDIAVAGAIVTVTDATQTTRTATTDADGGFSLSLAAGQVRVTVTADNYDAASTVTAVRSGGPDLSLPLTPTRREVRQAFEYVAPERIGETFVAERVYPVRVHHTGQLTAGYTGSWALASAMAFVCIEVRDSQDAVLAMSKGQYDIAPAPIRLNVTGGSSYTVRFFNCERPVVNLGSFSGEVTHPS